MIISRHLLNVRSFVFSQFLVLNEKYTQFHLTVKNEGLNNINTHEFISIFLYVSYITETVMSISGIRLLVGLVRSLKSSHKRGYFDASLCENISDLTSPTSNHYNCHVAISVVSDTL